MSFAGIVNVGWRRARAPENVDIELVVVENSGRAYERLDAQIRVANKIDMDVKGKPAPNSKQTQRPQQLAITKGLNIYSMSGQFHGAYRTRERED